MDANREKYCPNMILDTPNVSIGEFRTISECMSFPIPERWCINRKEGNKFDKYKSQGNKILIICCWDRHDAWRFVVAIVKNGVKYFDLNDLPMDLVRDEFEEYLGADIVNKIHSINNQDNNNKLNKNRNMKQTIKLTESELKHLIRESVKRVLNEGKPLPAPSGEFKQDRDSLLQIKRHLEEFRQGLTEYDPNEERYENAINTCIACIDRAMVIMDKTLLFTTDNFSEIPIHWGSANYDENGEKTNPRIW